jgi:transposase
MCQYRLVPMFEKPPRCIVGMACLDAHSGNRTLRQLGFEPRIVPAIYAKPLATGQKSNFNDTEAIAEVALRPNFRAVQEKTQSRSKTQSSSSQKSSLAARCATAASMT